MKIWQRIFLMLIVITIGAAVIFGIFTRFYLLDFFSHLETEQAEEDLSTIRRNLEREHDYLFRTLGDWSSWDDTYQFAWDQNDTFRSSNLMEESWRNLDIDSVLIWTEDGSILYSYGGAEKQLPVFRNAVSVDKEYSGFLEQERLSLVAIRNIRDSSGHGPSRGWFMMSRNFGAEEIASIMDLFPTPFTIESVTGAASEAMGFKSEGLFDHQTVQVRDGNTIDGFYYFKDLFGNDSFLLKTETERVIYNRGFQVLRFLIFFTLAIVAVSLAVFVYMSYRYVISPLALVSGTVRKIIKTKALDSRIPIKGDDEIGTLGQDVNTMLDTIVEDQEALRESETRLKQGEKFGRMGYWEYEPASEHTIWTEGLYALYELSPEQPDSPKDIFFREFMPEEKTLVQDAVESIRRGGCYRYIHRIRLPDGRTKFLKEEANGVFKGSELVKVVGTTQDVTEVVLIQRELQRSQEQLKSINIELEGMNRELQDANKRIDHLARTLENMLHLTTHISDTVQGNVTDFLNQLLTISLFLVENIQYASVFVKENKQYVLRYTRRPKMSKGILPQVEAPLFEPLKNRPIHIEWDKVVKGSAFDQIKAGLGAYVNDLKESLFIPLTVKQEVYGALSLEALNTYPGKIQEEDKRIAESLGNIGSSFLTLQNALAAQDQFQKELILSMIQILEIYDPFTKGHSENVAKYAFAIALKLKMDKEKAKQLYWTGLVHDIGKLLIPKEILNKPTKLTKEEFEAVKNHSEWGSKVLNSSERTRDIARIVLSHHERVDGLGYPEGLQGDQIPLESKIIAVADAFDAMTNDRSYKRKVPLADALEELERCKGTQFDPVIVDLFIREKLYLPLADEG